MTQHLFLVGGGPPTPIKLAQIFSSLTRRNKGHISILIVERDGWKQYVDNYTKYLDVSRSVAIPLPSTPVKQVVEMIQSSAGIIIGGGETNVYANYIVDTPIARQIKQRYDVGIPVLGFSAGALISPEQCIISPKDNDLHILQQRPGLGLIQNTIIAVHFSQWQETAHLREIARLFSNCDHYGIDEQTGLYFVDGQLTDISGYGVYQFENDTLKNINQT